MSAPAQKARSPAPVSTTARTSRSPSIASQIACSSRSAAASMAFSTSGRSMVTRATWSFELEADRHQLGRWSTRPARARPAPPRCAGRASPAGCGSSPARPTCGSASPPAARVSTTPRRLQDHAVDRRLLVGQRLGQRAHRRAEEVLRLEPRDPVRRGVRSKRSRKIACSAGLFVDLQLVGRRSADRRRGPRSSSAVADVPQRVRLEGADHARARRPWSRTRRTAAWRPSSARARASAASAASCICAASIESSSDTLNLLAARRSSAAAAARAGCPGPDACRPSSRRRSWRRPPAARRRWSGAP